MFNVLIDRMQAAAPLRKAVAFGLLMAYVLGSSNAVALEKYPDLSPQTAFENATNNGHLLSSGFFIARHKGAETDIGFTLSNTSNEFIDGPYRLVLKHFFSFGRIRLDGIDGYTQNGEPYILVDAQLAPGETSAPILITLKRAKKKGHRWFARFYKRFGNIVYFKPNAQRVIKTRFSSKNEFTQNVLDVLDARVDFYDPNFFHEAPGRLIDVADAIHYLAVVDRMDDLDLPKLLSYLSAYANNVYQDQTNLFVDLNAKQANSVNIALREVANMSEFGTLSLWSTESIRPYAHAVSHFYYHDSLIPELDRHLFNLAKLFARYGESADIYNNLNQASAMFETIKAYANLLSKGKNNDEFAEVLRTGYAIDTLTFMTDVGMRPAAAVPPLNHGILGKRYNTYVLDWLLHALSQHRLIALDRTELAFRIDDSVRHIVDAHSDRGAFSEVLKTVMYRSYLSNAYPGNENKLCNREFAAQCLTDRSSNTKHFTENVLEILNPATDYERRDFAHNAPNRLLDVINAIKFLARGDIADPALERLLNYLNAYGFHTKIPISPSEARNLHQAYLAISNMNGFSENNERTTKVLTQYILSIKNLYKKYSEVKFWLPEIMPVLTNLITKMNTDRAYSHPMFKTVALELIRTYGWLADDALTDTLIQSTVYEPYVLDAYQALGANQEIMLQFDDELILMDWYLWTMSNLWWAAWHDKFYREMVDIDNRVKTLITSYERTSAHDSIKLLVYDTFLDSTGRESICDTTFSEFCIKPDAFAAKTFPDRLECREVNVKIIAEDMTAQQLHDTCSSLATLETKFHEAMQTSPDAPVLHDQNDLLNLVVYDDHQSDKRLLGLNLFNIRDFYYLQGSPDNQDQYFSQRFNIDHNNGGQYVETAPTSKVEIETQAALYVFEARWQKPEFLIWNVKHEFIHYLDGRYIKHGIPERAEHHDLYFDAWWREGLAEYIALGNDNPYALATLKQTAEQNWPSLQQIFHAADNNPLELVYDWSYWAYRFMHTQHHSEVIAFSKLLNHPLNGNAIICETQNNCQEKPDLILAELFATLDYWAISYQAEFVEFLQEQHQLEISLSELFKQMPNKGREHQHQYGR